LSYRLVGAKRVTTLLQVIFKLFGKSECAAHGKPPRFCTTFAWDFAITLRSHTECQIHAIVAAVDIVLSAVHEARTS